MFSVVVPFRSLTRRQALRAGALAAAVGAVRLPSPALAAPGGPALFELDLARVATSDDHGWRTTEPLRAPRRFDMLGLHWEEGPDAQAQVRVRRRRGEWSQWLTLHPTGDHGPDEGSPPAGTEPAFTGTADEFQLRLKGRPRGLRVRFVRALPTASLARRGARRLRNARASAHRSQTTPATPFPLITRDEWGAAAVPPRTDPEYGAVELAFVHHTVTANDYAPSDSAAIVLGIARYHRDSNGWNDIGYNFLVDRYGQIFEGRAGGIDQPVVGAQAQGYNSVSTGVACLGTFESVDLTSAGMKALARVIGWKLSLHGVPVEGELTVISAGGADNRYSAGTEVTLQRISGHRDGDATSCPGDGLYGQLGALRSAARRYAVPSTGLTARVDHRTVTWKRSVRFSGDLRFSDGSDPAFAPVSLEFQTAGSAWTVIGGSVAGSDGGWEIAVQPPTSGLFRAVFPGDATRAAVASRPVRVDVVPRLGLKLDHRQMRRGRRVRITGTVDPQQQVQVVVERRVGRRWHTGTSRLVRVRHGRFGIRVRLRTPGSYRVTAIAGKTRRRTRLKVH